jgi:hypothetical protein
MDSDGAAVDGDVLCCPQRELVTDAKHCRLQTTRHRKLVLQNWLEQYKKRRNDKDCDFVQLNAVIRSGALKAVLRDRLDNQRATRAYSYAITKYIRDMALQSFQSIIEEGPNCAWLKLALEEAVDLYHAEEFYAMRALWARTQGELVLDLPLCPNTMTAVHQSLMVVSQIEICAAHGETAAADSRCSSRWPD